jgi:hypothetical protein
MEIIIVILVLVVLLVLFGGAGYFFVRETGWDNARLWLTAPRQLRGIITPADDDTTRDARTSTPERQQRPDLRPAELGRMPLALDESALRSLREELQGELTRAAGITRDFDARLTRLEADLSTSLHLPDEIGRTVQDVEVRTRRRLTKLRSEVRTTRMVESSFGQRRSEALADLYRKLAQVESTLAAVVNPMLLPGEPLNVPEELYDDTLEWSNWSDVGERAFSFGQVFNQSRFLLEPQLADQIERFIATFRQALTGTVYPVVQNEGRTKAQIAQMRHGLGTIIEALPPVRREIEAAYRATSLASMRDNDDDDDDDFDA